MIRIRKEMLRMACIHIWFFFRRETLFIVSSQFIVFDRMWKQDNFGKNIWIIKNENRN